MSDTKTEEEPRSKEPAKKGLHGWKAATAVFGCGTLAAFGVFGVIVGVLSMFLNVASSGLSSAEGEEQNGQIVVPEQTIKPRDSLDTGALDLCGGTIPQAEVSATRADPGDAYEDPGEGEVPRVVVDHCIWNVIPAGGVGSPWELDFSYAAFVTGDETAESSEEAVQDYEERVSQADSLGLEAGSSGEAGVADDSQFFHGLTGVGTTAYVVILRSGDTVYEMNFESNTDFPSGDLIPAEEFEYERDSLLEYIEIRLGVVGPG
ncbi:hypothetical protein [Nocardiopsis sp. JB363]|uniref:hypothetical protein n=1 Tax=Nocardiopsis sp. JB363 TaxID=1434837 RepID=UPI00117CB263|nr:hypothetical protein [Nocardiopsis sp. JB363]